MKCKADHDKTFKILFCVVFSTVFIIVSAVLIVSLIVILNTYFGDDNTDYEKCKDYFQIWVDFYIPILNSNNIFTIVIIILLNPISNIISQYVIYRLNNVDKRNDENFDNKSKKNYKPYIKRTILCTLSFFMITGLILCNYGICNAGTGQADRKIERIRNSEHFKENQDESHFENENNDLIGNIKFDFNDPLFHDYTYIDILNNYEIFMTSIKMTLKTKVILPDKLDEDMYNYKTMLADVEYRKGNKIYSLILRQEANEYKLDAENIYLIGICLKDLADEAYRNNDLESAFESYTRSLSYDLIALQYVYTYTLNSNTKEYNSDFVMNIFDRIDEILDAICLSTDKNSEEYLKAKLFKALYNKEAINQRNMENIKVENFTNYKSIKEFIIFELDKNIKDNRMNSNSDNLIY